MAREEIFILLPGTGSVVEFFSARSSTKVIPSVVETESPVQPTVPLLHMRDYRGVVPRGARRTAFQAMDTSKEKW